MINYKEIDVCNAYIYDQIEMKVNIDEIYEVKFKDINGISFTKLNVQPYIKDFNKWDNYVRWKTEFDLSNWLFFIAFDGDIPIGGATLCYDSPEINMLEQRKDLGVLWDIRVDSKYKHCGVGQHLFDMIKNKAKSLSLKQLKIECQNNNIPAVNFYLKQGAHIGAINKYAYYKEKDVADEVQLLMYLDI